MKYLLSPHNKNIQPFAYWENAFNNEQLNWLQKKARESKEKAQVGDGSNNIINSTIRISELNWIGYSNETEWLFQTLSHVVSTLNSEFFHFDLTGFGEEIQLTNYNEEDKGMYKWHVDFSSSTSTPSRKLSLVLQLSDPSEYEGGNLELKPFDDNAIKIKKQRGLIVCFPSWTIHQVTPVTQGSRQSLVSWITGPAFK